MPTILAMSNPPEKEAALKGWMNRSFPEVAKALRNCSARVVDRWQAAVKQILPAAEHLTLAQLRDHIPLIVDQIIEILESDQPDSEARMEQIAKPHGDVRFHQAYNIDEVMIEYSLLRRVMLAEIAAELSRSLTTDELAAVNFGIDMAHRRGVVAFVKHLSGQLAAADELHGGYLSYLNHELRGGMNGVLLMIEVLKHEITTDPKFAEAAGDFEAMRRSVLESVATMDRFVYAHKLGRGLLQARHSALNLPNLLKEIVGGISHAAKERKVEISVEADPACALNSDADLVRLILQNVLSNAIRYARRDGGKVTFTVRPRAGGGCHFILADEGLGIAPEQLASLFAAAPPAKGSA